jgi:hypothetical protein
MNGADAKTSPMNDFTHARFLAAANTAPQNIYAGTVPKSIFFPNCEQTAAAKVRGFLAHYVPHVGKAGWQDYNLIPFAAENDYTVVTNNRKHFLRE